MDSRANSYEIIKMVGQGTFGKVFEAFDANKRKVAIKRVKKTTSFISREIDILHMINHSHCIKLLDVFYTVEDEDQETKWQNLVFEYCPNTIASCIRSNNFLTSSPKKIFHQLCLALNYIHKKNICHRDLTPNNILLSSSGEVRLADFGSAKALDNKHVSMSYICSRFYRAPELLLGHTSYSTKIDVWSAGCILAEMLLGRPLFSGSNTQDQFIKIVLVLGSPTDEDLAAMRPNYNSSIKFPAMDSLKFSEMFDFDTPQLAELSDLLDHLLRFNPSERYTMEEALRHPYFDDMREERIHSTPMMHLNIFDINLHDKLASTEIMPPLQMV